MFVKYLAVKKFYQEEKYCKSITLVSTTKYQKKISKLNPKSAVKRKNKEKM